RDSADRAAPGSRPPGQGPHHPVRPWRYWLPVVGRRVRRLPRYVPTSSWLLPILPRGARLCPSPSDRVRRVPGDGGPPRPWQPSSAVQPPSPPLAAGSTAVHRPTTVG